MDADASDGVITTSKEGEQPPPPPPPPPPPGATPANSPTESKVVALCHHSYLVTTTISTTTSSATSTTTTAATHHLYRLHQFDHHSLHLPTDSPWIHSTTPSAYTKLRVSVYNYIYRRRHRAEGRRGTHREQHRQGIRGE